MSMLRFTTSIFCCVALTMSFCVLGLAQEVPPTEQATVAPDQLLLPQFELTANSAIDDRIRDLLKNNVTIFNRPHEKMNLAELRLLRFAARRQMANILATEGYFSPTIKFENAFDNNPGPVQQVTVHVNVELGPPTKIEQVHIGFLDEHPVAKELQQTIQSQWSLLKGEQFRDADWSHAKAQAVETLMEHSYAAAKISSSEALVQDQKADLSIELDSGPAFRVGELHVKGLHLYEPWLLERYHPPVKGELYSQDKLVQFQRSLQNSPYFSTATVSIDPNPEHAAAVPIDVVLQERKRYDFGLAAGYSTNTRMRGEISFQDRDFIGDAYNLKSAIRLEQLRQIGYADIFLPPKPSGYLDSFGVLFDRSDIEGLVTQTSSFGAKRVITENGVEKRLGLSFIYEQSQLDDEEKMYTKALVPSIGRTWRVIDNTFDPHQGHVTQVDLSAGAKLALSDQNFVRLYAKHQQWIPINLEKSRDVVILRAEGGYVLSKDDVGIPENLLFRAGGTGSVRGYAYQSLGVDRPGGVEGGRILVTASAEYVHWLPDSNWGVAGFVDVGDAADRVKDLSIKQGIGLGARYKTPAGPIAIDLAYGLQAKKLRFDFFLGIAF